MTHRALKKPEITVFMAVPTIYSNLIKEYESKKDSEGTYMNLTPEQLKQVTSSKR